MRFDHETGYWLNHRQIPEAWVQYNSWQVSHDIKQLRRRAWHPTPVFLPGESPWMEEPGGLQSDMTEVTQHTHDIKQAQLSPVRVCEGDGRHASWMFVAPSMKGLDEVKATCREWMQVSCWSPEPSVSTGLGPSFPNITCKREGTWKECRHHIEGVLGDCISWGALVTKGTVFVHVCVCVCVCECMCACRHMCCSRSKTTLVVSSLICSRTWYRCIFCTSGAWWWLLTWLSAGSWISLLESVTAPCSAGKGWAFTFPSKRQLN